MDGKEFAKIVHKTKKVVLSSIGRHLPSRYSHAIDDIAQETYIRAYRSLVKGAFRNQSSLETWLYAIARNETLRALGKFSREEKKTEKAKTIIPSTDESGEEIDHQEMFGLVKKLPEVQRDVFLLLLRGRNLKGISRELSIPVGTVKSRISRGKEGLKKLRMEAGL
jgi:RNA polymerase sigma-70 factor (ECF subfamily)